jgi:hypothetical protein
METATTRPVPGLTPAERGQLLAFLRRELGEAGNELALAQSQIEHAQSTFAFVAGCLDGLSEVER